MISFDFIKLGLINYLIPFFLKIIDWIKFGIIRNPIISRLIKERECVCFKVTFVAMSFSPERCMEFNHEQNKQTLMVSDITTQVVPDINHTTHSSPSVVDHPDEEKLEEKEFQLEEDELALHRLLNDFDGGSEKEYHSFEHAEPPPGYRFSPTDIDLVMHYLIRKVLNHPLPWNRIVDVQLYDHSPEWLAGSFQIYFMTFL